MKYTEHTLESAYDNVESINRYAIFSHDGATLVTYLRETRYLDAKIASEAKLVSFIEASFEEMKKAIDSHEVTYLTDGEFFRRVETAIHMPLHGGSHDYFPYVLD